MMTTEHRVNRHARRRLSGRVLPLLATLTALAGCGKSKATEASEQAKPTTPPPSQPTEPIAKTDSPPPGATHGTPSLESTGITLLQPEADLEQRVNGAGPLSDLITAATHTVVLYDREHARVLPSTLDVFIVARAGGVRVWLTGPDGDLSVPELDAALANLTPILVRKKSVAVVARMVRAGTTPTSTEPYLPTSWNKAAGASRKPVDDIVDAVWPEQ